MDAQIQEIKSIFISELWLPLSVQFGNVKAPRIKKNKNFRFFTLTTGFDYSEIEKFVKSNISNYKNTVAWTNNSIKKLRIESGVPVDVYNQAKYEDISLEQHLIANCFPFDIINLDFLSQDDWNSSDKLVKVIKSYSDTVKCQDAKDSSRFLIILTVPFDNFPILREQFNILRDSPGVITKLSSFPDLIQNTDEKISFIEALLIAIVSDSGFGVTDCKTKTTRQPISAISVAIIAKAREHS